MVCKEKSQKVVKGMKELLETVIIAFKGRKNPSQTQIIENKLLSLKILIVNIQKIKTITLTTHTTSHVSKGMQLQEGDED